MRLGLVDQEKTVGLKGPTRLGIDRARKMARSATAMDGKQFAARLRKAVSELDAPCKGGDGVQDYGNLLGSKMALEQEVQKWKDHAGRLEKDMAALREKQEADMLELRQELAKMTRFRDQMIDELGKKYKAWDTDRERHEKDRDELARVKQGLKTTSVELTKAKDVNEKLRRESEQLTGTLDESAREIQGLKEQCKIWELECRKSNRTSNKHKEMAEKAKEMVGILPLDTERL